jgi:putative flippase GtrA
MNAILKLRQSPEFSRFLKFLVVGALGFVIDFGVYNLLGLFYNDPTTYADDNIRQAISFSCAVVSNALWNYFWIYPEAKQSNQAKKFVKFLIVSVLGLGIRSLIYTPILSFWHLTEQPLHLTENLNKLLADNLALATVVLVVLFWNFFANRYWTYKDV